MDVVIASDETVLKEKRKGRNISRLITLLASSGLTMLMLFRIVEATIELKWSQL